MKIESLQQLKKLIALCRKEGIDSIKVDGIELQLGTAPIKSTLKRTTLPEMSDVNPNIINEYTQIDTPDELSSEAMLFYSAVNTALGEQQ